MGEVQGVVCPAGSVANVAGVCVQAAGVNLVLPVGTIPLIGDQSAPSVQSVAHIVILGHQAGQKQLTSPISPGLPLGLQVRGLNMIKYKKLEVLIAHFSACVGDLQQVVTTVLQLS